MSEGQGSISYNKKGGGAQPPFVNVAGARNGTSLDTDSFVVLGQDEGAGSGGPAALSSNRQIPLLDFFIEFLRATSGVMRISQTGFVINQGFPNAVSLSDLGLEVGTVTAATLPESSFVGVFDNSDDASLGVQLIPSSFGIGTGVMLASGQPDAPTNFFLFFYSIGGVALGGSDFANNMGNKNGFAVDGAITGQKFPVVKTAAYGLDNRFDSGKVFTNTGATGLVVLSLPDGRTLGASGFFDFYVDSANGIQVQAPAGNTIMIGASLSAEGGSATALIQGNALRLLLLNPGASVSEWVALSVVGTWTVI
jgi:hypothetical protein